MNLEIKRNEKTGEIWSHLRNKWLIETPEETVRQNFLLTLINEYNYSLKQIDEEVNVSGRGSSKARADFLIWKSELEKKENKKAFIVVEIKADYIKINKKDYKQGDSYARQEGADLFLTHNSNETKIFKVLKEKRPQSFVEIERIPKANEINEKESMEEIFNNLKEFTENEFANVLKTCHNIIRNREKLDPAAAFDEISKILFIKVYIERGRLKGETENIFTKNYLITAEKFTKNFLDIKFSETKDKYKSDELFKENDKINLRYETIKSIIKELEVYNLSETSSDLKGIAFEKFLGRTFRGEIGQFFTPRPIVNFMINFIKPEFGKTICDPACGSGGFLIKYFQNIKEQIEMKHNEEYLNFEKTLKNNKDKNELLKNKGTDLYEKYLNQEIKKSDLWFLSNRMIYGTDANERMARTSKMNMIMHGDGHGGIHHNDGLYDINGIFENRFDFILTNPPFGSTVEEDDLVEYKDILSRNSEKNKETIDYYNKNYNNLYTESVKKWKNRKSSIGDYYDIRPGKTGKTEVFFMERCINLLNKGGTLGIVLPEGILNNPSLKSVRNFCEGKAKLLAVISIPQDVFISSKATVKTSIIFMKKFTQEEENQYKEAKIKIEKELKEEEKYKNKENEMNLITKEIETINENTKLNTLKKSLRILNEKYNKELKKEINEKYKKHFNYNIFMAEVKNAGINTVGEIDEELNELPEVLEEYEKFLKEQEDYKYE
jgi:type I restriction enzyme M protein